MPGLMIGNIDASDTRSLDLVNIWQYDAAEKFFALLNGKHNDDGTIATVGSIPFAKENISGFWKTWYDGFFNIDTAEDYGLLLWGKVLGVEWVSYLDPDDNIAKPVSSELYRRMIKGKFFAYGCNGSVPDLNKYLQIVFPGKKLYVRDNYNMTITVVAFSAFTAEETAVLLSGDFMPVPMGVKSDFAIVDPEKVLGFKNSDFTPFWNGDAELPYGYFMEYR